MEDSLFYNQADLLLRVIPYLSSFKKLAIKGGTAINFFVRDLPRLSVDIDLAYIPIRDREESLRDISEMLRALSNLIKGHYPRIIISERYDTGTDEVIGLIVKSAGAAIKIEVNVVMRGSVYAPEERELSEGAQKLFERFVVAQTLSFGDLYGSKICAALDRQHPRDLFDIYILFQNEGITESIRKAFLVYLISHNRPMIELLNPNPKDIGGVFEKEFAGMTLEPVDVETLVGVREKLIESIQKGLTEQERRFLVSVKQMKPEWDLLGIEGVGELPGVRWKLINLRKMNRAKHRKAVERLRSFLGV